MKIATWNVNSIRSPVHNRCTACEIFRDERKGESPSDHVPVMAEIDLS